jgi:hypothetical protein
MQRHHVLNAHAPVGCDRLALVTFPFVDFSGASHSDGQIVVLDAVDEEVLDIFQELYQRKFPLESAKLMDEFNGDDSASMLANNTSGFNDRNIAGGTVISMHAYGTALDINPVQNPAIVKTDGVTTISPPNGESFTNRSIRRPGMAEEVIPIMRRHGFVVWGGVWNNPKDYQHFQVDRPLSDVLMKMSSDSAKAYFARSVNR